MELWLRQFWQVLVALDQLLNTLVGLVAVFFTGALHWADETYSAMSWRKRGANRFWRVSRWLIDTIFFWQDDHCYHAYESERLRRQLPAAYRTGGASQMSEP
ncbi:MAG: hypothetical protein ABW066_06760 [Sedimenticola sp.]